MYNTREKANEYARKLYAKDPTKYKEINNHKRNLRKRRIYEHFGGCCVKCGSTDNLEVDHINPAHKKSKQSFYAMGFDKVIAEEDNLQLLCHDCHKKKSHAQKQVAYELFRELPLDEQEMRMLKYL